MATIASLGVRVFADTKPLSRGLNKGRRDVRLFSSGIGALNGVLATLGATLSVGAVITGFRSTAEFLDRIGKKSRALDISANSLMGLGHAATLSGSSLEGVTKALTILQKNIGTGESLVVETLNGMGLSIDKLRKLSADKQLLAIARGMQQLPDPTAKTAAAMNLLGRSGADLLPLLLEGPDAIRKMMSEVEQFTDAEVKGVEKMNDSLTRLKQTLAGLAQRWVIRLAPVVEDVVKRLNNAARFGSDFASVASGGRATDADRQWRNVIDSMNGKEFSSFQQAWTTNRNMALGTLGISQPGGWSLTGQALRNMAIDKAIQDRGLRQMEQTLDAASRRRGVSGSEPPPFPIVPGMGGNLPTSDVYAGPGGGEWAAFYRQQIHGEAAPLSMADRHRINSAVGLAIADLSGRPTALARPSTGGTGPGRGFQALEGGTAEAFAQSRRSAVQEVNGILKQSLDEQKQQTLELRKIDAAINNVDAGEIVNIA